MSLFRLGDYTDIKTGKLDVNAENPAGKYPFFTCSKNHTYIDEYAFEGENVLVAGNGDLNVKYYNGRFNAYQRTYVIQTKNTLDTKYLYYFLENHLEKLRGQAIGGVIKYIKIGNLTEAEIPLPPLEQQQKIAAILDAADELRQKDKALVAKYDELTQALFLDMFGNPVKNPMGWNMKYLGSLSRRIVVGHVGPTSSGYAELGIPFLRTQNVRPNFINYKDLAHITVEFHNKLKKSQIFANDVLISRVGVNRGMAAVVPDNLNEANCANVVIVGNTELLNSYYLSFFLNMSFGRKPEYGYSVGSAQGVVNTSIVKRWPIFNTPIILQNQFAERVKAIEEQKSIAKASALKSEELFNSLLQKAFNGELV
jgi:type I restriction enzyme S subunit